MTKPPMRKSPTKAAVHRAAKQLNNPKASAKEKSSAGKTLAKHHHAAARTIKSPPKKGSISRSDIRLAVKYVSTTKKK